MLEIEVKCPVTDFVAIERRLTEWGATPEPPRQEADHYYNAPDRDFARTDEALRLGLKAVYEEALAELEAAGHLEDRERLEKASKAPTQAVGHPLQEAAAIERLLDEGLAEVARARLREARAKFPDDPDLAELEKRIG